MADEIGLKNGLTLAGGFKISAPEPIDDRTVLSTAQMLLASSPTGGVMLPPVYFAVNTDNNNIYIYNKNFQYTDVDIEHLSSDDVRTLPMIGKYKLYKTVTSESTTVNGCHASVEDETLFLTDPTE